jgi:hypothetical protein
MMYLFSAVETAALRYGHPCVTQVFVANPNKTSEIREVLARNKEKLLKYLGDFHTDKGEHSGKCCMHPCIAHKLQDLTEAHVTAKALCIWASVDFIMRQCSKIGSKHDMLLQRMSSSRRRKLSSSRRSPCYTLQEEKMKVPEPALLGFHHGVVCIPNHAGM